MGTAPSRSEGGVDFPRAHEIDTHARAGVVTGAPVDDARASVSRSLVRRVVVAAAVTDPLHAEDLASGATVTGSGDAAALHRPASVHDLDHDGLDHDMGMPAAPPSTPGPWDIAIQTYNILADCYAFGANHSHCPRKVLAWEHRSASILRDIRAQSCAVVCLQEVQRKAFDFLLSQLSKQTPAYMGWLALKEGGGPDGVATFYRPDLVVPLEARPRVIELGGGSAEEFLREMAGTSPRESATPARGQAPSVASATSPPADPSRFPPGKSTPSFSTYYTLVKQRHVAQVALFRMTGTALEGDDVIDKRFVVCNVHLHWDPRVPEVKLLQAAVMCKGLTALADEWSEGAAAAAAGSPAQLPIVVTGDFNSLPVKTESDEFDKIESGTELVSGVYELLTTGTLGHLHPHHPITRSKYSHIVAGATTLKGIVMPAPEGKEPVPLRSAYSSVLGCEPAFTNFTADFKGTLDYVFASPSLEPVAVLSIPPADAVSQEFGAIPDSVYGSDHLPLVVWYRFT